jgi:hypothetical protein
MFTAETESFIVALRGPKLHLRGRAAARRHGLAFFALRPAYRWVLVRPHPASWVGSGCGGNALLTRPPACYRGSGTHFVAAIWTQVEG